MAEDVSKTTQAKISQLQMFEQSINNLLMQKQQFQQQLIEIDSALEELKTTENAYKIIANIMVKSDKAKLEKDGGFSKTEISNLKELNDAREKLIGKDLSEKLDSFIQLLEEGFHNERMIFTFGKSRFSSIIVSIPSFSGIISCCY